MVALSIGMAIAAGGTLLRWNAPKKRKILIVDGEMPLVSLQERLREISAGSAREIPNEGFRILAADQVDGGINLSTKRSTSLRTIASRYRPTHPRQPVNAIHQPQ